MEATINHTTINQDHSTQNIKKVCFQHQLQHNTNRGYAQKQMHTKGRHGHRKKQNIKGLMLILQCASAMAAVPFTKYSNNRVYVFKDLKGRHITQGCLFTDLQNNVKDSTGVTDPQ